MSTEPGGALRQPGAGTGPAGRPLLDQAFTEVSRYLLRATVAAHAADAGLTQQQVYDVVLTAHELATNAIRHGAGRGQLQLRADDAFLYCRVTDDGPADLVDQQAAGPAPWPRDQGHGLWLVDILADQFHIDRGPAGTTATAAFALSAAPAPR